MNQSSAANSNCDALQLLIDSSDHIQVMDNVAIHIDDLDIFLGIVTVLRPKHTAQAIDLILNHMDTFGQLHEIVFDVPAGCRY